MAKRKRKQQTRLVIYKAKTFYPMAYCLSEGIPVAVSHVKCKKGAKVNWIHFREDQAEFRESYEFNLSECKKGDKIHCPVCGGLLDFRFWMSDTLPRIVEFGKDVSGNIIQSKDDIVEEK